MAFSDVTLPRSDATGLRAAVSDTLARLVAEVADIVADPGVSEAEISRCLDRGLLAVAGASRLPDLATEAILELAPGQPFAVLPADWQHGPTHAFLLPGRRRLRVLPGLAALRIRTAGRPARGRIRLVAPSGGRLHVHPVPEAVCSLEVGYFRLPEPLAGEADKPLCLPPDLVAPLLVNFACRELFERLEEGVSERKVQATAYARRFDAALAELLLRSGPVQDEPVDIPAGSAWPWSFGEDWA
jgi:hypothetical protein